MLDVPPLPPPKLADWRSRGYLKKKERAHSRETRNYPSPSSICLDKGSIREGGVGNTPFVLPMKMQFPRDISLISTAFFVTLLLLDTHTHTCVCVSRCTHSDSIETLIVCWFLGKPLLTTKCFCATLFLQCRLFICSAGTRPGSDPEMLP